MLARKEQPQSAATVKLEVGLSGLHPKVPNSFGNIRPSSKNKRRFSDEQLKSLEYMFESDSRPESQIKQRLASELGLQPRQIAIWFQNRRARTKSKQIERDYSILKETYDALACSYESLKEENHSLCSQLQKLKSQLEMEHGHKTYGPNMTGESGDWRSENGSAVLDTNQKITFLFEDQDHMLSSDDKIRNVESTDEDGVVLEMMGATDGSLTSSEKWCSFEPNSFLDESSCSSNWWEHW